MIADKIACISSASASSAATSGDGGDEVRKLRKLSLFIVSSIAKRGLSLNLVVKLVKSKIKDYSI